VNEPFITAAFSARDGLWNEQLSDERAFARALVNVAQCVVVGARDIRHARPDAVLIQAETCQFTHPVDDDAVDRARLENELRFVTFELAFGRPLPPAVRTYLMERGIDPAVLAWFENNGNEANWIVGNDYYETSELEIDRNGRMRACGVRLGYAALARQYHERLRLPIMHTETNMNAPRAAAWLAAQWADVSRLREDGIPIRGFTWYGLVNHVDWDSTLTRNAGVENECGLVSLDRKPTAVYEQFSALAASELAAARS
jgi:beta-glucosidase/6-phospho-beta-glucosidase/beta-galactosidase